MKNTFLHSVKTKVLLPLLVMGAIAATVGGWYIQKTATECITGKKLKQAQVMSRMLARTSEQVLSPRVLQRLIKDVGAEEDVVDIVIAAESPGMAATVIATTRDAWLDKPLSELPKEEFADDLNQVIREKVSHHHFNPGDHLLDCTVPIDLSASPLIGSTQAAGAVMLHLDTRKMDAEILHLSCSIFGAFLSGLLGTGALGYALINRVVLRRIGAITGSIPNSSRQTLTAAAGDELDILHHTLRESLSSTARAITELENEKRILDKHALVAIFDAKGTITYANDKLCAVSGYSRTELLGQNYQVLKPMEEHDGALSEIRATMSAGEIWQGELGNHSKTGTPYWVQCTLAPLPGPDHTPAGYLAIWTDITALKQTKNDLRLAREAADSANLAKSEFLANMSHEIRTPMNAIIGFTSLLNSTPLNKEQLGYTQIIEDSGEALLSLIDDILDLSKIEAGKLDLELEPVDAQQAIEKALEILSSGARAKGLELVLEPSEQTRQLVMADAKRLSQILLNLVGNAIKFTKTGGVRLSLIPTGSHLKFLVTDTGLGISEEQAARLFQKYQQANATVAQRYGGTGLGLAISKHLVELMGGTIGVDSSLGAGSTFWFTLPCTRHEGSE